VKCTRATDVHAAHHRYVVVMLIGTLLLVLAILGAHG
jgi:hypothetical protein